MSEKTDCKALEDKLEPIYQELQNNNHSIGWQVMEHFEAIMIMLENIRDD